MYHQYLLMSKTVLMYKRFFNLSQMGNFSSGCTPKVEINCFSFNIQLCLIFEGGGRGGKVIIFGMFGHKNQRDYPLCNKYLLKFLWN